MHLQQNYFYTPIGVILWFQKSISCLIFDKKFISDVNETNNQSSGFPILTLISNHQGLSILVL